MEEARKSYSAYLDTLTDAPEKNMVWLRHFTEKSPTGYEEDPTLAAPFAYSAKKDKILYNPNAPGFAEMDFDFANTHENAHRADVMHMRSYRNEGFKRAVQLAGEKILKKG